MNQSLTDLANSFKSDKGDEYKCAHHYTRHYEQIFTDAIFNKEFSLIEIGLNRDDCTDIPSLRMYKQFFPKAKLHGFDIRPEFMAFNGNDYVITIGDQGSPSDLSKLCSKKYEIIIDDGSHASSHQQISLRELWKAVKPGGYYIIEDLHWQPWVESCMKTVDLARAWMDGSPETGDHLTPEWLLSFSEELASIQLLPSYSLLHAPELTRHAFLVLKKK